MKIEWRFILVSICFNKLDAQSYSSHIFRGYRKDPKAVKFLLKDLMETKFTRGAIKIGHGYCRRVCCQYAQCNEY